MASSSVASSLHCPVKDQCKALALKAEKQQKSSRFKAKLKHFGRYCYACCQGCTCGRITRLFLFYFLFALLILTIFYGLLSGIVASYYHSLGYPPFRKDYFFMNPGGQLMPARAAGYLTNVIWYKTQGQYSQKSPPETLYVKAIATLLDEQESAWNLSMSSSFDRSSFGPCAQPDYGYPEQKPCLFLKMHSFLGWVPQKYSNEKEFQEHLPMALRKEIHLGRSTCWVHCQGEHVYDEEKIGKIEYYPGRGYNDKYYPTKLSTRFVKPLLAIKLNNIQPGFMVSLICSIYAKNMNNPDIVNTIIYIEE